jgi:hypothetical protein
MNLGDKSQMEIRRAEDYGKISITYGTYSIQSTPEWGKRFLTVIRTAKSLTHTSRSSKSFRRAPDKNFLPIGLYTFDGN